VSLTTSGETCLRQVEEWLEKADELTALIDNSGELSGVIRVATSTSFGLSQLVPAIKSFMIQHPRVNIDIDLQDGMTDLVTQRIDLAIRIASNPDPSLIGKPLAVCASVLVASPDYLAKHKEITQPSDLNQHECLGYKHFERHVWHLSCEDDFVSIDVSCRLTANETTALCRAAIEGMGIALQPWYLVADYIASGLLQPVLANWKPNDLEVYALYSSRKHLLPETRALIDHLQDYLLENPLNQ
jgi:DNA-binding transcriptional LysR family regulator